MKRTALMTGLILMCSSALAETETKTEASVAVPMAEVRQEISKLNPKPNIRDIVTAHSNNELVLQEFKKISPLNYKGLLGNNVHSWLEARTNRTLGSTIQPQMLKDVMGVGVHQWSQPYTYSWLNDKKGLMIFEESTEQFLLSDAPMNNVRLFVKLEPQELVVYFSLKEAELDRVTPQLNDYFKDEISEDDNILSNGTETVLLSNCYDGKCSMEYTVKNFMSPEAFNETFQKEFFTHVDVAPSGIAFHQKDSGLASITLLVKPEELSKAEDGLVNYYGKANYPNLNDGTVSWISKDGGIRTFTMGQNAYIEFANYTNEVQDLTKHQDLLKCYDQTALQADFEKSLQAYEAFSNYICSVPAVEGIEDNEWAGFCQSQQATTLTIKDLGINNIMVGLHESAMNQQQIEQLIQSCSQ